MDLRSEDVEFRSGGEVCRAWSLAPDAAGEPRPCIVIAHGLGLTRRSGLRPFAEAFARNGYSALVFDYRTFGDSEGSPRQVISFRMQLEDWAAAIRFARTLPGVEGSKVVTWSFSLGAGHAVTSATRDGRVAAVVSIAPMLSGLSATLAAMRWWSLLTILRLMGRGVLDVIASIFRRNPVLVPISAPAGDLGLLTSPDAYPGYEAIVPSDFEFGTAARIALYFWTYAPGRPLRRLRVPVLLMPSTIDKICPPRPTLRRARSCPHVEVVELECEHMEAVVEPNRTLVIDATLEFLQKHVS